MNDVLSWAEEYLDPNKAPTDADELISELARELNDARLEIGRLRSAVRVNGLRAGYSDAEINAVLDAGEYDKVSWEFAALTTGHETGGRSDG